MVGGGEPGSSFSPSECHGGLTTAAVAGVKWASLGSTMSPLQTLNCRAEKNTSASIKCACAKSLCQDICSWSNQGEHCAVMADWERVRTWNRRNKLSCFGRGTKFVVEMGRNIRGVAAFGTCLEECHCKQGGSLKMFKVRHG